jgi:hypothetical protein
VQKSKQLTPLEKTAVVLIAIPIVILIVVALVAFQGLLVWAAWNFVLPSLFGMPVLTYGQAVGLSCLMSLIAGYFRVPSRTKE